MGSRSLRSVLYCGLAYFVIGVMSAIVANPVESGSLQAALRLVALFLGLVVFLLHLRYEIAGQSSPIRVIALRSASALAVGTFLLAVFAVVSAMVSESRPVRSVVLALLVWPLVTAALGFLAAAGVSAAVRRWKPGR